MSEICETKSTKFSYKQQTDKVDEDFDAKKCKSEQISLHYGLNEWNKVSLAPGFIFWSY